MQNTDYGKFKYEAQKRANEARKKQKIIEVKEIKLRPNIDEHDYQVKMRNVQKFLNAGDKVKVTLRFCREMAHQEPGANVLTRVREETDEFAKVEAMPNGRSANDHGIGSKIGTILTGDICVGWPSDQAVFRFDPRPYHRITATL